VTPVEGSRTQVFISAKSADYDYASQVYGFLTAAGVSTFFSQETLPQLGVSDYRRQIEAALDETEHLVVVTSSVENVSSPWVEHEWGSFITEKLAGRKGGNLITVVLGSLQPQDLPLGLRHHEVLPFDPPALERLLRYVQARASRPPPHAREMSRARPSAFREASTFGGAPRVHLLAIDRASRTIATGAFDGAVRLYDIVTRSRRAVVGSRRYWSAGAEGLITALEFSNDGRHLASGHFDGAVHAWRLDDELELPPLMKHETPIVGLAFSGDGRSLTTASSDGVVKVWNLDAAGAEPESTARKAGPVVSLRHVEANDVYVTGVIRPGALERGETAGRYEIHVQRRATSEIQAAVRVQDRFTLLRLSADGGQLAAGSGDGSVRVYAFDGVLGHLSDPQPEEVLPPRAAWRLHAKPVKSMAFFPDGQQIVTAALEKSIVIWDLERGKESFRLQGIGDEAFTSAAPLGGGTLIAATLLDGRVRLWEAI
jgi:hypothetical protein